MRMLEHVFHFPPEVTEFLRDSFELMEVRGRVGCKDGISFSVRSNEGNHVIPHVHARFGEYEISIAIETGAILAGNLPKKNQKIAVSWVANNRDKLLSDWRSLALSAPSAFLQSRLDFIE